jgi:cephalosporin hydroxylase
MHPLWEPVISPLLQAARPRRVVVFGAPADDELTLVRGLLDAGAELHMFDADGDDHALASALGPVDLALIGVAVDDREPDWDAVSRALSLLVASARGAGEPFPIVILRGIGPRDGAINALDDDVTGLDVPVRHVVVPRCGGLAILATDDRLAREPASAQVLDWLESADGKDALLEASETARVSSARALDDVREHLAIASDGYVDLLEAAVLNEIYLDHELRLAYLAECIQKQMPPEAAKIGDPARELQISWHRLVERRRAGALPGAGREGARLPYTDIGRVRLEQLRRALDVVRDERVAGEIVECGTGRGGTAIFMRGYLDAYGIDDKTVWIADGFRVDRDSGDPLDVWTDLDTVRDGFARFGLLDERVRFLQGRPADALEGAPIDHIALMRIGPGTEPLEALVAMYGAVAVGGVVIVDDAESPDARPAIDAALRQLGIDEVIERVDGSAVSWRKTKPDGQPRADVRARAASHAPIAAPAPANAKDLSVVVVFYNMRREAERSLHALSRAYQQSIADLDYEVIVIENGSAPDQVLGEEFVRSFGPEFRYVNLGADATPTPVDALNWGLELASGKVIAFMIDGAHILTPGVLRHGMAGLQTYAPAIVATQQWYVGPGQQPDAILNGYDQSSEDELFRRIEWPLDGYRLFEIGHFIGDRDWFDGLWESNCIFVPRELLEQFGTFDERFAMAGGGYANLEFYERLGGIPGVNIVTMLGEGSFHQVHGGTTTNVADPDERRSTIASYAEHFEELHGRPFRGSGKTIHYVGTMFQAAARTRARRMTADVFVKGRGGQGPDGIPETSTPIPDELKLNFIDASWRSLAFRKTSWLGRPLKRAPTDLLAYQEIVSRVRPDWIIETGTQDGGRALFFASICELLDHGQVLSLDVKLAPNRPEHPRITYLEAVPQDPTTVERVRALVGTPPRAVVLLGSQPASNLRIEAEFNAYREFVPLGSYVIVEHTIYNAHPVFPGHGPGPWEAVRRILANNIDFAIDPTMERHGLTFNPEGYLKRI